MLLPLPLVTKENYEFLRGFGINSEFGETYQHLLHVLENKAKDAHGANIRFYPVDIEKLNRVKKLGHPLVEMIRSLDQSAPGKHLEFVFKYKKYNGMTDEEQELKRVGTREAIARRGGSVIEDSIHLVDAALLDLDGTLVLD